MKLSEKWLREWINPTITSDQLMEQLTMAGLEVESTQTLANLNQVYIGEIVAIEKHPQADRLRVCQVAVGQAAPLTIVCGGVNARLGLKTAAALVDAVLPTGMVIKPSKIRGVESFGMLCSTTELGLAETAEGIMELPADAPVGLAINEYLQLPDLIIDFKLTPNRGDCFSVLGIAREVSALTDCSINKFANKKIAAAIKDTYPVNVQSAKDCPRYLGRVIRQLNRNAITPIWLQERLRRSGIRSIHPIVDITNYVMLELGQPLHAFDLAALQGEINVRKAHAAEKIILLDGTELLLSANDLVIADEQKVLALAGIMGGVDSGINNATQDVFLESAFFTPTTIAATARRLQLVTDSCQRFERGVDPQITKQAMERASQLFVEILGGKPGPIIEITKENYLPKPVTVQLRKKRIERILGKSIADKTVVTILQNLGMTVKANAEGWKVAVPSYRFDITLEVDLIEELARISGYEHIPSRAMQATLAFKPNSEQKLSLNRIRNLLMDKEYYEVINYSFVDPKLEQLLNPQRQPLVLNNPISADMAVMRTSLWPGLLNNILFNLNRQQSRIRLFEIGVCFLQQNNELTEILKLGGAVTGDAYPEQWGLKKRAVDFFDVKTELETLFKLTHDNQFNFIPARQDTLHPGKSAEILRNKKKIGFIGALHPLIQQKLEIQQTVIIFELNLADLIPVLLPKYVPPSKFPSIRRDLAFIVNDDIPIQDIQEKIMSVGGELLHNLQLFDIYQGEGIDFGKKSVALSLTFQNAWRTLVDQEIDDFIKQVVTMLQQQFNAILRD